MKKMLALITLSVSLVLIPGFSQAKNKGASKSERTEIKQRLLSKFVMNYKDNKKLEGLRDLTLSYKGDAVPALIEVMKSSEYPEKNRWVATFLLGRIMGKKASAFISKFTQHPSWVLRMASLKTLLALKERKYLKEYVRALKDKSFIVRVQALENIRQLKIKKLAPHVWGMLYDKRNYYSGKKESKKRTDIIKNVITTIGDLRFEKAKKPLLKMVQKKKYNDIFNEIEYSLGKITGKDSPEGSTHIKRMYWKKIAIENTTI